jgi:3-oxosteroid 1-dehydrogenase
VSGANGARPQRAVRPASSVERFDRETDVLVVGAGAAGLSAALAARGAGVEVIVLEKAAILGGTTRKSSGWAWYPNNRWMREQGVADPKDDALRYMARVAGPERYDPDQPDLGLPPWQYEMLDAFYDAAAPAVEALREAGVQLRQADDFPDYFSYLPEDKASRGRVITPATAAGEPAIGGEMIDQMGAALEAAGAAILTEHGVVALLLDEAGGAAGAIADAGGEEVAVRARRGVVFGSGGFGQNAELRREMLAMPTFGSCAAQTNTGDFVAIATELGLPLRSMGYPWMTPMVLERALRNPPNLHSLFHAPGDSMLWVNRHGERRLNEKAPYNEIVRDMMRWDGRRVEYPDLIQVMVWDAECQRVHAGDQRFNPMREPGLEDEHVIRADSLPDLVDAVAARLQALAPQTGGWCLDERFGERLEVSIARFNELAERGVDEDFGRGETEIENTFTKWYGEPRNEANAMLYPLADSGPYLATLIAPGMLDTKGGPATDTGARVLDVRGEPVPGLFGAGNCVAAFSGRSYWGAGATIGPAVAFGRIAGINAAERVAEPAGAAADQIHER